VAHLWGVAGAAAGTTGVTVLANLITVYMACSVMKVSVMTFFSKTLLHLIFPLLLLAVVLGGLGRLFPAQTYLSLVLHVLVAGGVYASVVWLHTIDAGVRENIKKYLKPYLTKFRLAA
jgi:hypothetical protein